MAEKIITLRALRDVQGFLLTLMVICLFLSPLLDKYIQTIANCTHVKPKKNMIVLGYLLLYLLSNQNLTINFLKHSSNLHQEKELLKNLPSD